MPNWRLRHSLKNSLNNKHYRKPNWFSSKKPSWPTRPQAKKVQSTSLSRWSASLIKKLLMRLQWKLKKKSKRRLHSTKLLSLTCLMSSTLIRQKSKTSSLSVTETKIALLKYRPIPSLIRTKKKLNNHLLRLLTKQRKVMIQNKLISRPQRWTQTILKII